MHSQIDWAWLMKFSKRINTFSLKFYQIKSTVSPHELQYWKMPPLRNSCPLLAVFVAVGDSLLARGLEEVSHPCDYSVGAPDVRASPGTCVSQGDRPRPCRTSRRAGPRCLPAREDPPSNACDNQKYCQGPPNAMCAGQRVCAPNARTY